MLSTCLVLAITVALHDLPARLFFDTSLRQVRPYGLAYVAVIGLSTLLWGRRIGLVTLGLVTLASLFLLPPRDSFDVGDRIGWAELGGEMLIGAAAVFALHRLSSEIGQNRMSRPSAHGPVTVGPALVVTTSADPARSMRELSEWWQAVDGSARTWLLLGKGPSFERRSQYDIRPYTTIAINHVVREMPVFATSAVNYDVVGDCADAIYRNSQYLLMPRHPHSIEGEAEQPLEALFDRYPVLAAMSREGRLVWYNLSSDPIVEGSPVIQNAGFSVSILFNLLAAMGAHRIRTLGVDGGRAYAPTFRDIEARTRLANGMPSYDFQFGDIITTVEDYGLDYAPLSPLTYLQRLRMLRSTPASPEAVRRWLRRAPWLRI